jgi:hypothetical protein
MSTNSPSIFNDNWNFQAGYYSQIKEIIKENASKFIKIDVADYESDVKRATDFVVKVTGGDVAVRIRRANQKYRDLTIRSYNNGHKTELQKIKDGYGQFYLYCWTNDNDEICEWILVDLESLRNSGILENRSEISNKDGRTKFIAVPIKDLTNCLVAGKHG